MPVLAPVWYAGMYRGFNELEAESEEKIGTVSRIFGINRATSRVVMILLLKVP